MKEKFEDIKVKIRSRKSNKDIQYQRTKQQCYTKHYTEN